MKNKYSIIYYGETIYLKKCLAVCYSENFTTNLLIIQE